VAFVSALFSLLARKAGDILQAVFGWSVMALFGRLPKKKQIAVTIALVLALFWPLFLLGVIVPGVAGRALAFLPLDDWMSDTALRGIWIALAVVSPLVVGVITHTVAPAKKGGIARALLLGVPITIGYFVAFLITIVTVPIVKLITMAKGWTSEHVFVQPNEGAYTKVIHHLAEAMTRAGIAPEVRSVPRSMAMSTKVLKFFARGAIDPIVADEPMMVRGDGIELYQYPADLMLRGEKRLVARVRTALTKTLLDRDAYLVGSGGAKDLEDQIQRMWDVISEHRARGHEPGHAAKTRLEEIYRQLAKSDVTFEEWAQLERMVRRLERALCGGPTLLDEVADAPLALERARQGAALEGTRDHAMNNRLEQAPAAELIQHAVDETRELLALEVKLAKTELREEIRGVKTAAIGFGVAATLAIVSLSTMAFALILAIGATPGVALVVAGVLLLLGAIAAFIAYSALPKEPMEKTRRRLQTDVHQLKEHVA
jgi:uncharacterized membrane protein YqjE